MTSHIEQEHPDYTARSRMWRKYRHLYAGGEDFRQHAAEYLVRRHKEVLDVYQERLARVFYENYLGSIIDWYMATLVRKEPIITYEGASESGRAFFNTLTQDADLRGTTLTQFFKEQLTEALVCGKSYIAVDFPKVPAPALTRADEDASGRSRAYLMGYTADEVINWSYDDRGMMEWVVPDSDGSFQLGITESEVAAGDGSYNVRLSVAFAAPGNQTGSLAAPLAGLVPVVTETGGALPGGMNYFYAFSCVDGGGNEGPVSFIVQAATSSSTNTNCVVIDGISLPAGTVSFHAYRGTVSGQLFRIASAQPPQSSFTDTGLTPRAILPPDASFDHVNLYWRWELMPETVAAAVTGNTIGNPSLEMVANQYSGSIVRITRGQGAGQERVIAGNSASVLTVSTPWSTTPNATSYFTICENAWRVGASSATSPIPIDIPERVGSGVQISARAANSLNREASYYLSPVTRWVIGESGGLAADSGVPPAPVFAVALSQTLGGALDLGAIGFASLINTTGIVGGTYRFFYYDELAADATIALTSPVAAADNTIRFSSAVNSGALIQLDSEIIQTGATDAGGNTSVERAFHSTAAAAHTVDSVAYPLKEKVAIVPFVKDFFGSPASGDWKYTLQLPGARIASSQIYMTNALGDGAVSTIALTDTNDHGLRTLGGGQYSFQITGYLAIQTGAAPDVIVDTDRVVGQIYGVLRTASTGAGVTLQLNLNGNLYTTVQFSPGATTSGIVNGFGLPLLHAGDQLSLDVVGVGTISPGSDLTLIMSL